MEDFDKMAIKGKCNVCGKKGKVVVCNSALGAFSLAYCENCYDENREPYGSLVVTMAQFPIDYIKNAEGSTKVMIDNTLKFNKKTMQEFINDINKQKDFREEFEDFVNY